MKWTIHGVVCPDCKGKGKKDDVVWLGGGNSFIRGKITCPTCRGKGTVKAPDEGREGVAWERE